MKKALDGVTCTECESEEVICVTQKGEKTVTIDEYVRGERPKSKRVVIIRCLNCGYSRQVENTKTVIDGDGVYFEGVPKSLILAQGA